jgi:hypothetical protein
MTKKDLLALVKEAETEYDEGVWNEENPLGYGNWTPKYKKLRQQIENEKIFYCPVCGRMVNYYDLENWCCNFDKDEYLCSECYEEGMGEDL